MAGDGVKTTGIAARGKAAIREPSTWASVAALIAMFSGLNPAIVTTVAEGVAAGANPANHVTVISAVIAGVLGILLPERK